MTHPYREELAWRLALAAEQKITRYFGDLDGAIVSHELLRQAAAALRQSPSVEEVARVIDPRAFEDLAYAMDRLPAEPRSKYFNDLARLARDGVDAALAKAQAIARLWEGREG